MALRAVTNLAVTQVNLHFYQGSLFLDPMKHRSLISMVLPAIA